MQILSKESFSKIQYVIPGQNYANIYARLVLELPAEDSSLFSKILLRGDGAEWVVDDDLAYFPYVQASAEEKELIAISLDEKKQSVLNKLKALTYSGELLTIPSTDQIFYCKDAMGNISVKLTQWGFKQPKNKDNIDVISTLIAQPRSLVQSQVIVAIRYSDGQPAANESFSMGLFGSTVPFNTDENGRFCLGQLINGKPFTIKDGKGNEKAFTVNPSMELYEAEFPLYTNYDITVSNQEGTVCPDFNLVVNDKPMTTNSEGKLYIKDVFLTPKLTVEAAHLETNHKEIYTLSRDPEANHFNFVYSEKFFSSLNVQVRHEDGEGLPDFRIKVGNEKYVTDSYGHLHLEGFEAGNTVRVADATESSNFVDVELQRGDNSVELIVKRPEVAMVRIHMIDRKDKPLQNLPIKLQRKNKEDLEGTTDADGNVFFPASMFSDGERIRITCHINGRRMKLKMTR